MNNSVSTGMMKMTDDTLAHFGVKGMKWGKRKGSSVKAADARKKKSMKKAVKKRRLLSDADLKKKVERLKMEKQLKDLTDEEISPGKKFVKEVMSSSGKKVAIALVTGATLYGIKSAMTKEFKLKELANYMTPKPKK